MLTGAIAAEVTATATLRHATSSLPVAAGVVVLYAASYLCLAVALRDMDLSVAYAIWCAVGIAAIAAVGALAYHERLSLLRLVALALIVAAVAMLTLAPQTPRRPARHARPTSTIHIGVFHVRSATLATRPVADAPHAARHARHR